MKNHLPLSLLSTPIAHRGLWGKTLNENSIPAYKKAVSLGYPIEIDLYESKDGVLYSFHDKSLYRMTGKRGNIYDKTSKEINKLFLKNSKDKIPTFNQVLSITENNVPILIELKNQPSKDFVEKVIDRLKTYKGEYAVQSFNPLYLLKVRKLNKKIPLGVLTTKDKKALKNEGLLVKFVIKYMPFNFLIKPEFICREYHAITRKQKGITLAWTIPNKRVYKNIKNKVTNIVFENFIPD